MKINLNSLTIKFIAFLIPIMALILGASSYYNFQSTKQALEGAMDSKAESKLTSLVSIASYYLQNFETDLVNEMVTNVQAEEEVIFIAVRNGEGKVEYGEFTEQGSARVYQKAIPSPDGDLGSIEIGLDTTQLVATLRSLLITSISILLFVILILSISVVLFFRKKIISPVDSINQAMQRMESGDLSGRLAVDSRDEIAELKLHFNNMADSLADLVNSIKGNSLQMEQSALQVATISQEINALADNEDQSSTEVAAASSELLSISENVANLAIKATELAEKADQQARTGLQAAQDNISEMESTVEDVNHASVEMGELGQTAQSIHAIVDTIQSIAEQTNLLALNAAIEAARAGEQGRGFAVVADEVRTLAARTTNSVGEITGIVNQLSEKVDGAGRSLSAVVERVHFGQRQASISAQSIQSITEDISSASQANTEIGDATNKELQQQGILRERLDGLINSMSESAAKAGTMAKVGDDLYHSIEDLNHLLGQFSLDAASEQ
ncbi:methyl-accepting chemotaxis protein [endosymbiont of Lamellibrachia barhami]|uniref:methyl-accepting chemotaxis protein n=1 Tax=endosymbiont of Lamellibrachia barhami TaxID=205975 RepID=UPI0015B1892C|nr:methyl-accepting chemotaxis protein [endosymbiont of Lamellibrachia barhami]